MGRCKSIITPFYNHGNVPIPAASRLGPFICSGNISGFDHVHGEYPGTPAGQASRMFRNVHEILSAASATPDEILKMTVYLQNSCYRASVDAEWVKMFPDEESRPARQTIIDSSLPAERLMVCDIFAIADDEYREDRPLR